jgi:hypothetical protein
LSQPAVERKNERWDKKRAMKKGQQISIHTSELAVREAKRERGRDDRLASKRGE